MPDNSNHCDARSRLILALDVPRIEEGLSLLDRLQGHIGLVKVGLELFAACGPRAVEEVKARGFGVFLDLKLHDIPNTVAGAVRSARALEVDMLTIHTGGGQEMMKAAAAEAGPRTLILGVTVLTSLGPEDLRDVGICGTPAQVVEARARLASECGLGGVVCSPKEIVNVRNAIATTMKIITPGIRPAQSEMGDQKRAATPADAIGAGSDYLVVGRPISQASDPAKAASSIVSEIETALCLQR